MRKQTAIWISGEFQVASFAEISCSHHADLQLRLNVAAVASYCLSSCIISRKTHSILTPLTSGSSHGLQNTDSSFVNGSPWHWCDCSDDQCSAQAKDLWCAIFHRSCIAVALLWHELHCRGHLRRQQVVHRRVCSGATCLSQEMKSCKYVLGFYICVHNPSYSMFQYLNSCQDYNVLLKFTGTPIQWYCTTVFSCFHSTQPLNEPHDFCQYVSVSKAMLWLTNPPPSKTKAVCDQISRSTTGLGRLDQPQEFVSTYYDSNRSVQELN